MGACNSRDDDEVPAQVITREISKTQDFGKFEQRVMTNKDAESRTLPAIPQSKSPRDRDLPERPDRTSNASPTSRNSRHSSGFAPPPNRDPVLKPPSKPLPQRPNQIGI